MAITFGELRSTIEAARGDHERIDQVVWCILNAPDALQKEQWIQYALDKLYDVGLDDTLLWCVDAEPAAMELIESYASQRRSKKTVLQREDVRIFLSALAWRTCSGTGLIQIARPAMMMTFEAFAPKPKLPERVSFRLDFDQAEPFTHTSGGDIVLGAKKWPGIPRHLR